MKSRLDVFVHAIYRRLPESLFISISVFLILGMVSGKRYFFVIAAECLPFHIMIGFMWMMYVAMPPRSNVSRVWAKLVLCIFFAGAFFLIGYMMWSVWTLLAGGPDAALCVWVAEQQEAIDAAMNWMVVLS